MSEDLIPPVAPEGVLLTSADLRRWESEAYELEEKAAALRSEALALDGRATAVKARINTALELIALIKGEAPLALQHQDHRAPPEPRDGTWVSVLLGWINEAPDGLSSSDLHRLIEFSPEFSAKYAASDKGYYHALSRLRKSGRIVRQRGRYYSRAVFEARKTSIEEDDDTHRPDDISYRRSPMGDAILDLVSLQPGILGKDIVERLRADEEFREKIKANNTGVYNAIARLVQRGQINRRDSACYPGPNMPVRDPESKWLKDEPRRLNGHVDHRFAGGLQ